MTRSLAALRSLHDVDLVDAVYPWTYRTILAEPIAYADTLEALGVLWDRGLVELPATDWVSKARDVAQLVAPRIAYAHKR